MFHFLLNPAFWLILFEFQVALAKGKSKKYSISLKIPHNSSRIPQKIDEKEFVPTKSPRLNASQLQQTKSTSKISGKLSQSQYFRLICALIGHMEQDEDLLREKGIFRIPSQKSKLDFLQEHFISTFGTKKNIYFTTVAMKYFFNAQDYHELANLLKMMLKDSPFPLISDLDGKNILRTMEILPPISASSLKNMLVNSLDEEKGELLQNLFCMLSKVAAYSNENSMNVHNLAIVFAGVLFDAQMQKLEEMHNLSKYIRAVELLIQSAECEETAL